MWNGFVGITSVANIKWNAPQETVASKMTEPIKFLIGLIDNSNDHNLNYTKNNIFYRTVYVIT